MYVLHSEQNLFQKEAVVLLRVLWIFLAHLENSKQKSKSNPNIYSGSGHLPDFWSNFTLLCGPLLKLNFVHSVCIGVASAEI